MQRLRVTFSRGEEVKYISHLDMMRLWERALRRAGVPPAYSGGYSPHPRISIAAPLPIGVTSEGELLDVVVQRRVSPYYFIKVVSGQMPRGIAIEGVVQVEMGAPSLQSQVRQAEYRVEIETDRGPQEVEEALGSFMGREHVPWQHMRQAEVRRYDIRSLVDRVWLLGWGDGRCQVGMRLRNDNTATGRPEQVSAALGFGERPLSIVRTRLILSGRYHDAAVPR